VGPGRSIQHRRCHLRLAAVVLCLEVDLPVEGAAAERGRKSSFKAWRRRPLRPNVVVLRIEKEQHLEGGGGDKTGSRTACAAVAERGRRSTGGWAAAVFGDPRYFREVFVILPLSKVGFTVLLLCKMDSQKCHCETGPHR
jgi:hypothetical protein